MRVLVTGAGGMLGRDVEMAASNAGHEVCGLEHTDLDVTDSDGVFERLDRKSVV